MSLVQHPASMRRRRTIFDLGATLLNDSTENGRATFRRLFGSAEIAQLVRIWYAAIYFLSGHPKSKTTRPAWRSCRVENENWKGTLIGRIKNGTLVTGQLGNVANCYFRECFVRLPERCRPFVTLPSLSDGRNPNTSNDAKRHILYNHPYK